MTRCPFALPVRHNSTSLYGYFGVKGLSALLATASTASSVPVKHYRARVIHVGQAVVTPPSTVIAWPVT